MDFAPSPESALKAAITILGSQAEMARLCGISQPAVWKWVRAGKRLPPEHVLTVEAATGVPRWELRPDLYPPEEYARPAVEQPGNAYSPSPGTRPSEAPAVDGEASAGVRPRGDRIEGIRT
jgi:DNA-binding transcriptional regulator YdaS (Cro superfamily)